MERMRRFLRMLAVLGALFVVSPPGAAASHGSAVESLRLALRRDMRQIGGQSGAFVLDLSTGAPLFADNATVGRLPASVQKLYTTTTVLDRFGPNARLRTTIWGRGHLGPRGVWRGTLYLKGGGDPTFGWASFDRSAYGGTGATVEKLVSNLIKATGITGLDGTIVADASYFDSLRSTPESDFRPDIYMTGELSALAFDRGFADYSGTQYQAHPSLYAAEALASALRSAGVSVPQSTTIRTGRTPADAQTRMLAEVRSPRIARLIQLTNTPSDNFLAEMLLKGLGASFGAGGTTADGVAVVRSEMTRVFGIRPRFNDGSGLSYADSTTPSQVVTLLQAMAGDPVFRRSLAIAGHTGTLEYYTRGTAADGRCQGKTGTLHSVANLSGYCRARDGHTLAFAILANSVSNPDAVHAIEANQMAPLLARYNG
jgi:D-alanyl-D-alanine carboxypeptidase/D-alanyl-D-alanine-endopeptidase (penicillin-binding protein 4)